VEDALPSSGWESRPQSLITIFSEWSKNREVLFVVSYVVVVKVAMLRSKS